ncbi:hypothetical protein D3C85_1222390 [compost metagenome]
MIGRPFPPRQPFVQPGVGRVQHPLRLGHAIGVTVALGPQDVGHQLLLRRRDIVVEHPVHHSHFDGGGIVGDQAHRAGMMHGQMFDDGRRLDHGPVAVLQHREFPDRPKRRQFGECGFALQQPDFERRVVLIQRDERLLAVGREGVGVELHAHCSSSG